MCIKPSIHRSHLSKYSFWMNNSRTEGGTKSAKGWTNCRGHTATYVYFVSTAIYISSTLTKVAIPTVAAEGWAVIYLVSIEHHCSAAIQKACGLMNFYFDGCKAPDIGVVLGLCIFETMFHSYFLFTIFCNIATKRAFELGCLPSSVIEILFICFFSHGHFFKPSFSNPYKK